MIPIALLDLPGLGTQAINDLKMIGITTPEELLYHLPSRYEDFSDVCEIASLRALQRATIRCVVEKISSRRIPGRRLTIIEAVVSDESGSIKVMWFNQPYLVRTIPAGTRVSLAGDVKQVGKRLTFTHPKLERGAGQDARHTGRIVPIYPLTGSLTQNRLRSAIARLLRAEHCCDDWMPQRLREVEKLLELDRALAEIHFPSSAEMIEPARRRLQFDELFLYELAQFLSRRELKKFRAPKIPADVKQLKLFVEKLPFTLTQAQRKASWEIVKDLERGEPMNRLLEGDVGSGKTAVAAIAAMSVAHAGYQTVLLAPTELLAEQHFRTLTSLVGESATIALCTRSHKSETVADIVVGTHALLQDNVAFDRLGLVIVDEQHRFGVEQRQALQRRSADHFSTLTIPHLLSMTATPIPRTLALTLYGDLDVSILDEMPKGRRPITTKLVSHGEEAKSFELLRRELSAGHQAFVVCPLIDPSDALGVRSVTELAQELGEGPLKGFRCEILHGRLKTEEREQKMASFVRGEIHVLVATTVIEVGVDVPNATVMWIEGAERFGLAQLHQLRGRVGRSDIASFCFLHPSHFVVDKTFERLMALVKSQNGFELAEKDLALRGPGEMYGTTQSGYPEFKIADLYNVPLIACARESAKRLIELDPHFEKYPLVKERVSRFVRAVHFE